PQSGPVAVAPEPCRPQRTTELPASVYYDNDFRFMLDLTMPRLTFAHPGSDLNNLILTAPDGSQAHVQGNVMITICVVP
ncbi:MAG: hypothetical protein LC799_24885, partial [Actinobacteria bacterium]|nr:hypothetical protein [Actinomycetota bacterium]